jgi:hypothetical protein
MGLPHSRTSRNELPARRRDSVLECGSPVPLSSISVTFRFLFFDLVPICFGSNAEVREGIRDRADDLDQTGM